MKMSCLETIWLSTVAYTTMYSVLTRQPAQPELSIVDKSVGNMWSVIDTGTVGLRDQCDPASIVRGSC